MKLMLTGTPMRPYSIPPGSKNIETYQQFRARAEKLAKLSTPKLRNWLSEYDGELRFLVEIVHCFGPRVFKERAREVQKRIEELQKARGAK